MVIFFSFLPFTCTTYKSVNFFYFVLCDSIRKKDIQDERNVNLRCNFLALHFMFLQFSQYFERFFVRKWRFCSCYTLIHNFNNINKGHVSLIQICHLFSFITIMGGEMETHIQELCIEWNSGNWRRVLSEMCQDKTKGVNQAAAQKASSRNTSERVS